MVSRFNFKVVLVEPEIPQNTGSIGRLCLATQSELHLIEPLGFEITHSRLKRAGLDYWEHLNPKLHPNIDTFLETLSSDCEKYFFTKKAGKTLYDISIPSGATFIFGRETYGLPEELTDRYSANCLRIPMFDARVRSLNLANAVSIAVYEGIRQGIRKV